MKLIFIINEKKTKKKTTRRKEIEWQRTEIKTIKTKNHKQIRWSRKRYIGIQIIYSIHTHTRVHIHSLYIYIYIFPFFPFPIFIPWHSFFRQNLRNLTENISLCSISSTKLPGRPWYGLLWDKSQHQSQFSYKRFVALPSRSSTKMMGDFFFF